jgi:hypothetical protein
LQLPGAMSLTWVSRADFPWFRLLRPPRAGADEPSRPRAAPPAAAGRRPRRGCDGAFVPTAPCIPDGPAARRDRPRCIGDPSCGPPSTDAAAGWPRGPVLRAPSTDAAAGRAPLAQGRTGAGLHIVRECGRKASGARLTLQHGGLISEPTAPVPLRAGSARPRRASRPACRWPAPAGGHGRSPAIAGAPAATVWDPRSG